MRSCRPTQVVQSEVRQFMGDTVQGDVQGIDAHVRYPLPAIAPALGKDELAAAGEAA